MKFKVGDKVKIISIPGVRDAHRYIGQTGTIKSSYVNSEQKTVYSLENHSFNYLDESFELVEDKIEVGDIINTGFGDIEVLKVVETNTLDTKVIYKNRAGNTDWGYFTSKDIKSKAPKQEVIGYELLKDLPGIPAGTTTKLIHRSNGVATIQNIDKVSDLAFSPIQLADITWFKPIYKPKEVVVKISKGREVKLANGYASIGNENLQYSQVGGLYNTVFLNNKVSFQGKSSTHDFQITECKVGCQVFTSEDIQLVYQAIQNLK